ncbi:flagellar hook-length control protein FliK [Pseudomonas sp. Q1-7]|uniref:flagellar hook-length control protein FliK n=1 Tax=Pseudomonas sp. Q1-7 TaxID=3020843 RepID=UPI0022FFDDEB|nr:flagellar hook-length control protein FliK [Pseudomonas sp. Q1-7]
MIQTFNAPSQPLAASTGEPLPLPAAQDLLAVQPPPMAEPAWQTRSAVLPPSFSDELLDSVDALVEAPAQALPEEPLDEPLASPAEVHTLPRGQAEQQAPAALTPELWLLSMLGQQNLQVQAQDTPAGDEPAGAAATAGDPLPPVASRPALRATDAAPRDAVAAPPPEAARAPHAPVDLPDSAQAAVSSAPSSELGAASSVPGERAAPAAPPALHVETPRAPAASAAPTTRPALFERTLGLHGNEARWGEQMLGALRDSVELQLNQRVQNATIRLDPPELGSLEILLRHESGQLNVQISASQADVARALQGTSERLRQELVGQNFLQVSVQVSADGQQGQGQQQHARARFLADEAPLAARETLGEHESRAVAQAAGRDVLVTV